MHHDMSMNMQHHRPGANRINKLTKDPVLPAGWHKVEKGLWRHDNGEESRINPSSMFTNNNFAALKSADSPPGMRPPPSRSATMSAPPIIASKSSGSGMSADEEYARESSYGRLQQQPLAASAPAQAEDDTEWWYMGRDNSQNGPVDSNELLQLLDGGHVHEHTYVWAGSGEWTPLSKTALFAARGVSEVSINEASSASGGERSLPPGWVQTPEGYYWNKNTQ